MSRNTAKIDAASRVIVRTLIKVLVRCLSGGIRIVSPGSKGGSNWRAHASTESPERLVNMMIPLGGLILIYIKGDLRKKMYQIENVKALVKGSPRTKAYVGWKRCRESVQRRRSTLIRAWNFCPGQSENARRFIDR